MIILYPRGVSERNNMTQTQAKNKTLLVIVLTLITMVLEVFFGIITKSMALTADGWHMGTHALALFITYFAYILSEKLSKCEKFSVSTDKIETLAGFISSLFLGLTGLWILFESVLRFFTPYQINFTDAIVVAIIGLVVNLLCILIMGVKNHSHSHNHCNHHKDYNFIAAYLHILADALTSFFAIFALLAGKFLGLTFLDPLVGVIGGVMIIIWAINLIKSTSLVLLDYKIK